MGALDAALDYLDTHAGAIRVVNLSLGRPIQPTDATGDIANLIGQLGTKGVATIVAAGNDASAEVADMFPAGLPNVIAVASTAAKAGSNQCSRFNGVIAADTASYFTTDGRFVGGVGVTISAPGETQENINKACFISSVGIVSLAPGGGLASMSGTSMASPHVAGIAARLAQVNGVFGTANVRIALQTTNRVLAGSAPLDSPTTGYSFDGEREGIAKAP
jgi:subtilisin family serine protease